MVPLHSNLANLNAELSVDRVPLGQQVANRLRSLIRDGSLAPGTRLVETELAELLKVSRGPVREALRDLDREGFVVISPRQGATVAEWSISDLEDAYDVRTLLEIRAIELVMARSAKECALELEEVLGAWRKAVESEDRESCADLDVDFHRVLWKHTGSRSLVAVLEQSLHPINTIFYINATRYDDLNDVLLIHTRIQDALSSAQIDTAINHVRAHMEHSLHKARQFAQTAQAESLMSGKPPATESQLEQHIHDPI